MRCVIQSDREIGVRSTELPKTVIASADVTRCGSKFSSRQRHISVR